MESIASIMEDHSEVDDHSLRYFVQSVKDVPEMHLTEQIEACIAIARRKILTMKISQMHDPEYSREEDFTAIPLLLDQLVFRSPAVERTVALMKKEHPPRMCGNTWTRGSRAYRCLTCCHDPTSAICVDCFDAGEHVGHNYNLMTTSGGCCDCGNNVAIERSGFCSRHRGYIEDPPEDVISADHPDSPRPAMIIISALCESVTVALMRLSASDLDADEEIICVQHIEFCIKYLHKHIVTTRVDWLTRLIGISLITESPFQLSVDATFPHLCDPNTDIGSTLSHPTPPTLLYYKELSSRRLIPPASDDLWAELTLNLVSDPLVKAAILPVFIRSFYDHITVFTHKLIPFRPIDSPLTMPRMVAPATAVRDTGPWSSLDVQLLSIPSFIVRGMERFGLLPATLNTFHASLIPYCLPTDRGSLVDPAVAHINVDDLAREYLALTPTRSRFFFPLNISTPSIYSAALYDLSLVFAHVPATQVILYHNATPNPPMLPGPGDYSQSCPNPPAQPSLTPDPTTSSAWAALVETLGMFQAMDSQVRIPEGRPHISVDDQLWKSTFSIEFDLESIISRLGLGLAAGIQCLPDELYCGDVARTTPPPPCLPSEPLRESVGRIIDTLLTAIQQSLTDEANLHNPTVDTGMVGRDENSPFGAHLGLDGAPTGCLVGLDKDGRPVLSTSDITPFSVHIILHRLLALFIKVAHDQWGYNMSDLVPHKTTLTLNAHLADPAQPDNVRPVGPIALPLPVGLALHPLRAQLLLAQIATGAWVRNGSFPVGVPKIYGSGMLADTMADHDIYLIQRCLADMDQPAHFLLEALNLLPLLDSTDPRPMLPQLTPDRVEMFTARVVGIIIAVTTARVGCGDTIDTCRARDLVLTLGCKRLTYSKLMAALRIGNKGSDRDAAAEMREMTPTSQFQKMLNELTDFAPGTGLGPGLYRLKPTAWALYDQFHPHTDMVSVVDDLDAYTALARDKLVPQVLETLTATPQPSTLAQPTQPCPLLAIHHTEEMASLVWAMGVRLLVLHTSAFTSMLRMAYIAFSTVSDSARPDLCRSYALRRPWDASLGSTPPLVGGPGDAGISIVDIIFNIVYREGKVAQESVTAYARQTLQMLGEAGLGDVIDILERYRRGATSPSIGPSRKDRARQLQKERMARMRANRNKFIETSGPVEESATDTGCDSGTCPICHKLMVVGEEPFGVLSHVTASALSRHSWWGGDYEMSGRPAVSPSALVDSADIGTARQTLDGRLAMASELHGIRADIANRNLANIPNAFRRLATLVESGIGNQLSSFQPEQLVASAVGMLMVPEDDSASDSPGAITRLNPFRALNQKDLTLPCLPMISDDPMPHAGGCGHLVHLSCYEQYQQGKIQEYMRISGPPGVEPFVFGETPCPLCSRPVNAILLHPACAVTPKKSSSSGHIERKVAHAVAVACRHGAIYPLAVTAALPALTERRVAARVCTLAQTFVYTVLCTELALDCSSSELPLGRQLAEQRMTVLASLLTALNITARKATTRQAERIFKAAAFTEAPPFEGGFVCYITKRVFAAILGYPRPSPPHIQEEGSNDDDMTLVQQALQRHTLIVDAAFMVYEALQHPTAGTSGEVWAIASRLILDLGAPPGPALHISHLPPVGLDLFHESYNKPCPSCRTPYDACEEIFICLLTGRWMCSSCITARAPRTDLKSHLINQGGMVALIGVKSSTVTVLHEPRVTPWGSLYLDEHDEEDAGYEKGRPTVLSPERMRELVAFLAMHVGTSGPGVQGGSRVTLFNN